MMNPVKNQIQSQIEPLAKQLWNRNQIAAVACNQILFQIEIRIWNQVDQIRPQIWYQIDQIENFK